MTEVQLAPRDQIRSLLVAEPGLHLREIPRRLGLSLRTTRYHLYALAHQGELVGHREGRFLRWFPRDRFTEPERTLVSLLRVGPVREILSHLAHEACRFTDLESSMRVSPASLSAHLRDLVDLGFVTQTQDRRYRIADPDTVRMHLALLRPRLSDALADSAEELFRDLG